MTEVPEDDLRDMERGQEAMEADLGKLGDRLEDAHSGAERHADRIEPEYKPAEMAGTTAGGDMSGESEGAQQGDDAEDAEGRAGEDSPHSSTSSGGGEPAVHETERVEPSGDGS